MVNQRSLIEGFFLSCAISVCIMLVLLLISSDTDTIFLYLRLPGRHSQSLTQVSSNVVRRALL